jgi:predicted PurR-regulated permease PerM
MSTRVKQVTPGWPSRDIWRAAAIVAAVYVALKLLWVGRSVFLLGFFGVLLGIVLAAGVDRLERFRIPRAIGAVLIVLLVFSALTGIGFVAAPQISRQMGEVQQQLPQAIDRVEQWIQRRGGGVAEIIRGAADTMPGAPTEKADSSRQKSGASRGRDTTAQGSGQVDLRKSLNQQLAGAARNFFSFFSSTVAVLGGVIVMLFVAIFVASDPGMYHRGLMHLFPHPVRGRAGEVLSATATTLR